MQFTHFDIHSHLNLSEFDADRDVVIARMAKEGIGTITVGVDLATSEEAIAIAEKHDHIFACVGIHPTDNRDTIFNEETFLALAKHPKVVAIGECGLDYFRLVGTVEEIAADKKRQRELFEKHIALALAVGKPLMIHARPSKGSMDAYKDTLDILENCSTLGVEQFGVEQLKANFHFFVGDVIIAQRALAAGCTMSFDGPITFSNDYDDVIRMLPLTSIMIETDAPFAAPVPHRGRRCEPWMVGEIAKRIAEIKDLPEEMVAKTMVENATRYVSSSF